MTYKTSLIASLLISFTPAFGEISVFTVTGRDEDPETVLISQKNEAPLIARCATAASASYNTTEQVALYSAPTRTQVGHDDREILAQTHKITTFSATIPGYGDAPAGLVACQRDPLSGKHRIVLSFHGTECRADLLTDVWARKVSGQEINIEGYVHGGFYTRYMQSREAMLAALQNLLQNHHGIHADNFDLEVTGHSMGGALATIAAADIKRVFEDRVSELKLVTFNSPRVVDSRGAQDIEGKLDGNAFRIWRKKDPISMVSFGTTIVGWFTGFKHVGVSVPLEAVVDAYSLSNHSLNAMKRDASSEHAVPIVEHVAFWDSLRNKATAAKQFAANLVRKFW